MIYTKIQDHYMHDCVDILAMGQNIHNVNEVFVVIIGTSGPGRAPEVQLDKWGITPNGPAWHETLCDPQDIDDLFQIMQMFAHHVVDRP